MLTHSLLGFLHPLIHLGFALEFKQPAIVAEALAQAALHRDYLGPLFMGAEKAAAQYRDDSSSKMKSLQSLLNEIRQNEKVATAAHWGDDNKIRDGVLVRAPQEMIDITSHWTVLEKDLEFRNAEMVNAVGEHTRQSSRVHPFSLTSSKLGIPLAPSHHRNKSSLTSTLCTA